MMYGANICKLVKSVYAHKMENSYIQLGIFYRWLIISKAQSRIKKCYKIWLGKMMCCQYSVNEAQTEQETPGLQSLVSLLKWRAGNLAIAELYNIKVKTVYLGCCVLCPLLEFKAGIQYALLHHCVYRHLRYTDGYVPSVVGSAGLAQVVKKRIF